MPERARAKWFSSRKGYGFLEGSDGVDVFVHFSEIQEPDGVFRTLEKGTEVEFELAEGVQGPRATHIVKISRPVTADREA